MEILPYLKGLVDARKSPVVICDAESRIVFMNKFAVGKYEKYGGEKMIGQLLMNYCSIEDYSKVSMLVEWFKESKDNNIVFSHHESDTNGDVYIVAIRDQNDEFIGFASAHEQRTPETSEPYHVD